MFDLNAIVSAALNAAVQQAVAPLVERIAALEKNEEYLTNRITALESAVDKATLAEFIERELIASLAVTDIVGEDRVAQIESRVAALEGDISHKVQIQQANITAALAERIAALESAPTAIVEEQRGIDDELVRIKQRVEALESETQGENRYLNRDEVNDLIQEAMDDHTSTYDHDDYDSHVSDDDKHFDGDIEDAIRDALSNMSFDISIR